MKRQAMKTLFGIIAGIVLVWSPEGKLNAGENKCVPLFNGRDLSGWDGDARYWSVQEGVIRGEGIPERFSPCNTFLIWRGGVVRDFMLKLKFKMHYGNSGVQYRSRQVSDEFSKWRVFGYQSEVADEPVINGFLFDENPRAFLAHVGEMVEARSDGKKYVVGQVSDVRHLEEIEFSHNREWNDLIIVARGNHVIHIVNGHQTIEFIDNDPALVVREGVLALQLHGGGAGRVEYKEIYYQSLPPHFGSAHLLMASSLDGWERLPAEAAASVWQVRDAGEINEGERVKQLWNRPAGKVEFDNHIFVARGESPSLIRTRAAYDRLIVRFQYRHRIPGQASVWLGLPLNDEISRFKGVGISLAYGAAGAIKTSGPDLQAKHRAAGEWYRHALHPANDRAVGDWNECEITRDKTSLTVEINRQVQNQIILGPAQSGALGFCLDSGWWEIRDLVVIPLLQEAKKNPVK